MRFNDSFDAPALVPDMVPTPQPDRGEMLIRVYAGYSPFNSPDVPERMSSQPPPLEISIFSFTLESTR